MPVQPESQEPSLWQLADVTIEKWVYGAETSRIYFRLTNNSGEAMYIMRDYELEKLEGGILLDPAVGKLVGCYPASFHNELSEGEEDEPLEDE